MLSKSDLHKIIEILLPNKKNKIFERYGYSENELNENSKVIERSSENIEIEINKVVWFLPAINNCSAGGIVTILKIAQFLSRECGAENVFLFEKSVNPRHLEFIRLSYPDISFSVLCGVGLDRIPDACVGICTFWTTAYSLLKYNRCRKKFYLLQDDERSFYAKGSLYSLVESTYKFGFTGITNSSAIQQNYKNISGKNCFVYRPGIDEDLLNISTDTRPKGKINVLVYSRPSHKRNCFESIIVGLKNVSNVVGSDYVFHLVGEGISKKQFGLNQQFVIYGNVGDKKKLKKLYSICSFGVSFITSPTYSYHQLDIITSGISLVSNYDCELRKYFDDECVYYIGTSPSEIEIELPKILIDIEGSQEKIQKSLKIISEFSWEQCGKDICNILRNK